MMETIYQAKHRLYRDYVAELNSFRGNGDHYMTEEEARQSCENYINSSDVKWINLYDNGAIEGFLIIGKGGREVHRDADFSIAEAYLAPRSRHKGILRKAVFDYLTLHTNKFVGFLLQRPLRFCLNRHGLHGLRKR